MVDEILPSLPYPLEPSQLAILLWLFVVTGREYETTIEVPIVIRNVKSGKVLVSDIPPTALVRFKGVGRGLIALQTYEKAAIELDISTINYFYDYPLDPAYVNVSSNLKVEPMDVVYPDTVRIVLEKETEARLPVIPVVHLELQPGFVQVGEVVVNPPKVNLFGPASLMKDLNYINTEEIRRENVKSSFKEKVRLDIPHPLISSSVQEVMVQAFVERLTETFFRAIPVTVENAPSRYQVNLEPETVTVKVAGAVSVIKVLKNEQISALVRFDRQWSGDITNVAPEIMLPEGVELITVEPDTLLMTLVER